MGISATVRAQISQALSMWRAARTYGRGTGRLRFSSCATDTARLLFAPTTKIEEFQFAGKAP